MKRAVLATAFLASCQASPPDIVEVNQGAGLDCRIGFEALVREIAERPGIVATEYDRGSNAFRDDRTLQLFLVTLPDHPAHPAVFVRQVALSSEGAGIISGACGYGDRQKTARVIEEYNAFDRLLNAEEPCYLCNESRLVSPTVGTRLPPPPAPPEGSAP